MGESFFSPFSFSCTQTLSLSYPLPAYKLSLELNDRGQSGGGVCTTRARAAPAPDRAAVAAAAPATGYLPFNLDAALYGHDPLAAMVGRSDPALAIAPGGRGGGYQRGAQQQQPAQGGWPALGGRGGNGWSGGGGGAAPAHNNPPHHRHGMFRAQDVVTWRDAAAQAEPVLRPGPGGWGQPQVAAAAAAERRSLSVSSGIELARPLLLLVAEKRVSSRQSTPRFSPNPRQQRLRYLMSVFLYSSWLH